MTDQERVELANAEFRKQPEFPALLAKAGGVEPTYNGVVGDSCDCLACNMRRQALGIAIMSDCDKGVAGIGAVMRVAAGYKGNVPNWATAGFATAFFTSAPMMIDEIVPLELYQSYKPGMEPNPAMYAKALKAVKLLFGEDSQMMKDLEAAKALSYKADKTPEDVAAATKALKMLEQAIAEMPARRH